MSRLARVVVPGAPHHVTQRGNYRQNIFYGTEDYTTYPGLLAQYSRAARLKLLGYCLMSNHVHPIAIPEQPDSLAKALGPAHCRYAHWMHARQHCTGHLWQNRFFSTVMDEVHAFAAMRYVERNPVRAEIVAEASQYRWSSALAHLTGQDQTASLDLTYGAERVRPEEWQRELGVGEAPDALTRIRQHTTTGRPLASKEFVAGLAATLQRALEPRPAGRPRKAVKCDSDLAELSYI